MLLGQKGEGRDLEKEADQSIDFSYLDTISVTLVIFQVYVSNSEIQ